MITAKRHSLSAHKTGPNHWIFHFALLALATGPFLIAIARVRAEPADVIYSNTLTEAERRAGWQLCFNGRTTAGWRDYQRRTISPHWKVIDGALTLQERGGKEGLGIVFERQFENFELILEWKIAKGANSGILYRVAESQPKQSLSPRLTRKATALFATSCCGCVGSMQRARMLVSSTTSINPAHRCRLNPDCRQPGNDGADEGQPTR